MNIKNYNERKGISLLIALGLVFAIMFFALLVGNVVVSSVRQSANVNRANEAYYAAEGALEQGLLHNYYEGIGYTSGETEVPYTGGVTAKYKIEGQVPEDLIYGTGSGYAGMYGIPTPGTGNVGTECDPLNPVIDGTNFTYQGIDYDAVGAADHPCNWNKIKVGETVTIPLYYVDENGTHSLVTSPSDQIILRIRTACKDSKEMCYKDYRYDLYIGEPPDPIYKYNEPVLTWGFSGIDGNSTGLDSLLLQPIIDVGLSGLNPASSTIVSEFKIMGAKGAGHFEVLLQSSKGKDIDDCEGSIIDFLTNKEGACWEAQGLIEPIFKFSIIKSLVSDEQKLIPYLEYQIITNFAAGVPTDSSQTITAEGFSGEFKQVLEVKQPQAGGLPEYVIQQ